MPIDYHVLPTINAILNSVAACLLLLGYYFVRRGRILAHLRAMTAAFGTSALFLVSYVTYHTLRQMAEGVGHTTFQAGGGIQYVYYAVLVTHLIGAIVIVPLVLITLYRGWTGYRRDDRDRIAGHRRIARWTLPTWLYVSVTGVLVYLMLYHLPGATGS